MKETVHLTLKHKWYDKIDKGKKTVEYRNNTSYWRKRVKPANIVVFHRGYTKTTMTFRILMKVFGEEQIEIYLGERVEQSQSFFKGCMKCQSMPT